MPYRWELRYCTRSETKACDSTLKRDFVERQKYIANQC